MHSMTQTNPILIEVAAFTPQSALSAAQAGAHRIELCSGFAEGGLSPSAASIAYVKENTSIPIHVMIRPRIGDFVYNKTEKEIILKDIAYCKQCLIDGVVIGALTPEGNIDTEFVKKAVQEAFPMSVTFHRAFDICADMHQALEQLIECKVNRILTSGGQPKAPQAADIIASLVNAAANKITILPGGGISVDNVKMLIEQTGVKEIHFSGKKLVSSPMPPHPHVSLSSCLQVDDYNWFECDMQKIKEMRELVDTM